MSPSLLTFHACPFPEAADDGQPMNTADDPISPPIAAPFYTIQTHGQLEPHLSQEWLLTNGMGAFSSSSVVGCNRRRYHGLLCAAVHPPLGRVLALSRIGEILYLDGRTDHMLELSVNQFEGGNIHPRGDRYLRKFELSRHATWHFDVEGVQVKKEVQLLWGQNVVGVRYTLKPYQPRERVIRLELLPFVAMRDFHSLRRGTDAPFRTVSSGPHMKVELGSQNALHIRADWGSFREQGDWWTNHKYPIDSERGQDDTEDLFNPGRFVLEATGELSVTLWAGLTDPGQRDFDAELARRPDPTANHCEASPLKKRLLHAASDFIVRRNRPDGKSGTTIIAGYPWFADWGRDSMISLPGLLLVPGRFAEAAQVLTVFAQYVSDGMIPNRFDDYTNEPSYNTVDASLWFVHACYEYLKLSKDNKTFESELLPACREIIRGYKAGTRYNIHMDERDGLIDQGDHTTQLTWMDAKMGDTVFTPRHGKAVEINALWYNGLRLMNENALADRVRDSFARAFWISPFRGLADVARGSPGAYQRDQSIRPNQVFAVSLPHSPLTPDQQAAVVEVVRRELLTPYGPRTLNRADPKYCPHYGGNQWCRDGAYHNGTVWPWLIGPFLEAYLKVNHSSDPARQQVRQWLQPLLDHMTTGGCIGQIPECFDADEPQRPVGTPAQAWSVAEVLRIAAMVGI
jgi:predicted glycogen debranching enzyme